MLKRVHPFRPKPPHRLLHFLPRRRLGVMQYVIHSELLPFEFPHLMERQYIHALDVPKTPGEPRDLLYFIHRVCPAGHQDKTNPDAPAKTFKTNRCCTKGSPPLSVTPPFITASPWRYCLITSTARSTDTGTPFV